MLLLQTALSFAGNSLTILVITLLLRDARDVLAVRLAIPLFIGSIGFSISMLPEPIHLPTGGIQVAVFVNAITFGFSWLFSRALIEDDFTLGAFEWGFLVVTGSLIILADAPAFRLALPNQHYFQLLAQGISVVVMVHIMWIAMRGYNNDLVDNRRRVRIWFTVFVILSYVVLMLLDLIGAPKNLKAMVFDATTILINLSIILWATRFQAERIFTSAIAKPVKDRRAPAPRHPAEYARLVELMKKQEIYREPGLSLRSLAEHVGIAEHKLRPLINTNLGYRNFSAFINSYRLKEAQRLLSDPTQKNLSILAIALDSGYRTLSTFNRAFKSKYNETPSEYRARALGGL